MIIKRFLNDESGATAIEYGLIAALIALAITAALGGTGGSVAAKWGDNANRVSNILD